MLSRFAGTKGRLVWPSSGPSVKDLTSSRFSVAMVKVVWVWTATNGC